MQEAADSGAGPLPHPNQLHRLTAGANLCAAVLDACVADAERRRRRHASRSPSGDCNATSDDDVADDGAGSLEMAGQSADVTALDRRLAALRAEAAAALATASRAVAASEHGAGRSPPPEAPLSERALTPLTEAGRTPGKTRKLKPPPRQRTRLRDTL